MPSKKSKCAFQFSVESLSDDVSHLFMWTFTWADALDLSDASKRWSRFLSDRDGFRAAFPCAFGLRVFEIHPGKLILGERLSHGLPVHALFNQWLSVDIVRSIWTRKGGGRIHVKSIPKEKAIYVGKYLAKARPEGLNGHRLWAPSGDWEASKVRDIVVDSDWSKTYRLLAATISGFTDLRWDQRARIVSRVCLGVSFPQALVFIGLEENWDADSEARQEDFESLSDTEGR